MLIYSKPVFAQAQLIVTLNNNNTETFAISEIRSIKFISQTMNLQKNNGSISTWNISDIANYRFEGVSGLNETELNMGSMQIYPNPADGQTFISFSYPSIQHIRIEILDLVGRTLHEVYNGKHLGEQRYGWQPNVPSGMYLVRLRSENGMLTQTIVIQ